MRRLRFFLACALAALPSVALPAAADDWGIQRDPFDRTVIARYKAILARNPHDASALAKVFELYRRYRTVDLLKDEYSKVLDKSPDDWSALVVMGRLQHTTGEPNRLPSHGNRRWKFVALNHPSDRALRDAQRTR